MKIAFTTKGKDWNSEMDPRFGRTQFFLIYDDEKPSEEVDVKFLDYKNIDIKVSPKDYLIIVTRGHRNDMMY